MRSNVTKMMNNNRKWILFPAVLILVVVYLSLMTGTALAAQPTQIQLLLPGEGKIGDEAEIEAVLTNNENIPLAHMEIVFYTEAEFANVTGNIEIGRSETDSQGKVSLTYLPRTMGEQSIIANFEGTTEYEKNEAINKIIIKPGPDIHIEESGINVPGVGAWIFALAVGVVWGIFFGIMVLLELIARKGAVAKYQGVNRE